MPLNLPVIPEKRTSAVECCDGKMCFPDWKRADRTASRINRFKDGARLSPYRCPFCDGWHIGNSRVSRGRRWT